MRGKLLLAGVLAAAAAVVVGCHNDKRNIIFKPKEECVLPPAGDPRFDNPPSAEYRKRPEHKDEKALIGANKMGANPLSPGGF